MNYFTKKNIVVVIISILLIVNIASISTVIYLTYKKQPVKSRSSHESYKRVRNNLRFSSEQRETFEVFYRNYQQKTREIFHQLRQKKIMMMDEFSKPETDSTTLNKLALETGHLHTQLKLLTIDHLLDLKKICTPEQFQFLEGVFRKKIMEDEPKDVQFLNNENKNKQNINRQLKRRH